MSRIDTSGLESFINKINNLNFDRIAEKMEQIGLEEFNSAYSSDPSFTSLEITANSSKKSGLTRIEFIIKDNKDKPTIAFFEFGTGYYSLDYEGKKPTQTIAFESGGVTRSTAGWEYYYPNDKAKRNIGGVFGWFLPKGSSEGFTGFDIGEGAHNTFYRACQKIKERLKKELSFNVV